MRYSKMIFAALSLALFLVLGGGLADAQIFEVGIAGTSVCPPEVEEFTTPLKIKETWLADGDPTLGTLLVCEMDKDTKECLDGGLSADLTVGALFTNSKLTSFLFLGEDFDLLDDGSGSSYLILQGKGTSKFDKILEENVIKNFIGTFILNDFGVTGCFANGTFKSGKRRLDLE